jgi:hypothetical protein
MSFSTRFPFFDGVSPLVMPFAASRERIVHLPSALPLMKENVNKHGPKVSKTA